MLARAAEIRADEQRQFADALADMRNRVSALAQFVEVSQEAMPTISGGLDTVSQQLGGMAGRQEVNALGERIDEAIARMDAQDRAIANLTTLFSQFSERMLVPTETLGSRLDGVSGRFEGVSGRLDGLADQNNHLHSRFDELNNLLHSRFEELNNQLNSRFGEVNVSLERLHAKLDALPQTLDISAVHRRLDEFSSSLHNRLNELGPVHERLEQLLARPAVDPTERFNQATSALEQITERVTSLNDRINDVEESVRTSSGTIVGYVEQSTDKLNGVVGGMADRDEVSQMLWAAQAESEKRMTVQIKSSIESLLVQMDSALAQLGEMMISGTRYQRSLKAGGRSTDKKSLEAGYGDDD